MNFLLHPYPVFWILLLLAAVLYKLKRKKASRVITITAFAELVLFSATPLPAWMLRNLETQYATYTPTANTTTMPVLILGGSHHNDASLNDIQDLSPRALARLSEGLRLYYAKAGNKLVMSGRKADNTATALTMAKAALLLGLPPGDTLMMVRPKTTWEEASEYKKRFGTDKEFLLVTSAAHMPRAMETFRSMGMKPIAAPADFLVKSDNGSSPYSWGPSVGKLSFAETAIHEYIGLYYYRWFKE